MQQGIYDVAILGGGLSGSCLALQLLRHVRSDLRIAVLEKNRFPLPEAAHKVGESSVELGAYYFDQVLGLGSHIQEAHLPKFGLRFFFNQPGYGRLCDGLEMGLIKRYSVPSFQLDRGILENHLAGMLTGQGVDFLEQTTVQSVSLSENEEPHVVRCRQGNLRARWVVDACGRRPILKRDLDLAESVDHPINSVWFRIGARVRIDDWDGFEHAIGSPGGFKSRWLSTNHLMGPGYWVWLIPLSSGATSIGIVADERLHPLRGYNSFDKALAWLAAHEPACGQAVAAHQDHLLDFLALKQFSHACRQTFSAQRWAITGEAGMFLDPFYSPGSDFIAVSNTFITELIREDVAGNARQVRRLSPFYDEVYRDLFWNTLAIYKNQYPLFGNSRIMTTKILWDYALYWAFPAFLYIQGLMTKLAFYPQIMAELQALRELGGAMQQFFRDWHQVDQEPIRATFIDQCEVETLARLNAGLVDPLTDTEAVDRFKHNAQIVHQLAWEIVQFAVKRHPGLAARWSYPLAPQAQSQHLVILFNAIG